jgi:hypothetical protein
MGCLACKWIQRPETLEDEDVLEYCAPCLNKKSPRFGEHVDIDDHCDEFEEWDGERSAYAGGSRGGNHLTDDIQG